MEPRQQCRGFFCCRFSHCGLKFTGKVTAHGKTWESWVKRYVEKKTRGEKAEIEAEKLD